MSATVAAEQTADLVGGTVVDIPGEIYPLDIRWAPPARGFEALMVEPVYAASFSQSATVRRTVEIPEGDVLVFAPGVREVERLPREAAGCAEVARLLLPAREQDRVLSGLSFSATTASAEVRCAACHCGDGVAESSLTVPADCC